MSIATMKVARLDVLQRLLVGSEFNAAAVVTRDYSCQNEDLYLSYSFCSGLLLIELVPITSVVLECNFE